MSDPVVEYLSRIKRITWEVKSCDREMRRLYRDAGYQLKGIDYSKDRIQSSASNNQYAASDRYLDLYWKRERKKIELINERDRIIDEIHSLTHDYYSEILERHFVDRESLLVISTKMNLSYDWVRHLYLDALTAFADKFDLKRIADIEEDNTQNHNF